MNVLDFVQHAAAALVIDFTGFGETNASRTAIKQFDLELIFQFRDSLADGRDAHL